MQKAVFFDRDGIVNLRLIDKYVLNSEQFEFIPEIFEILAKVKASGYLAIVITNQQGIGKGLMNDNDLAAIHHEMQYTLQYKSKVCFDDIYFCGDLKSTNSFRRKPNPGMILEAAETYKIDLTHSFMIGDSKSDTEAANAAGVQSIFVSAVEKDDAAKYSVANHIKLSKLLDEIL